MLRFVAIVLTLFATVHEATAMSQSSIPTKVPTAWGAAAPGGDITCPMPIPSQISITPGRASWQDGFPPLNFLPPGAGGVPPFGQDMNGVLCQLSQWTRWQNAGAYGPYDPTFSSQIGGYPKGAILSNASNAACYWISTTDNNLSDPDTGGANWTGACPGGGTGGTSTGSANAQVVTTTPFILQPLAKVCWISGFTTSGPLQINVNGGGLINVLIRTLGGLVALTNGEVRSGTVPCATYDGTQYELDVSAAWASLTQPDQTLSGGATVVSYNIGALGSQSYTFDPGKGPLQYFTNNGGVTLNAPAADGSFLVMMTNGTGTPSVPTFSGFTTNANTGDALTTTTGNRFVITVWRINSVSSFIVKALQ